MAATATAAAAGQKASDSKALAGYTALQVEARKKTIRLVDVNDHFICKLCGGYFRDAHKIKECAHTFCSSCIRYYFMRDKRNNSCPTCYLHLGAKPWNTLVADPAIQGLADKLLPNYTEKEEVEKRAFYERHGFKRKPDSADAASSGAVATKRRRSEPDPVVKPPTNPVKPAQPAEKISFELHPQRSEGLPLFLHLNKLKQPCMITDASFRINQLRKYVALKLKLQGADQVEIFCRNAPVGGEYSLAFVHRTIWCDPKSKMMLEYRRTLVD